MLLCHFLIKNPKAILTICCNVSVIIRAIQNKPLNTPITFQLSFPRTLFVSHLFFVIYFKMTYVCIYQYPYIQILHCIKIKQTVDYIPVTPILLSPLTYSFYIVIRLTNHFHVCLYVEHAPKKIRHKNRNTIINLKNRF